MPMLPTGLQRDPKSGVYYHRRRIPTDLLPCYPGRKEHVRSLRTKDYRTALERLHDGESRLTAEWKRWRQRLADKLAREHLQAVTRIDALTPEAIDGICRHMETASLAGDEARRESETPYTLWELEEYQTGYRETNRDLKVAVARGDHESLRPFVEQFLQLYRYEVNASDSDMRRLALAFGRAAIRTNDKLLSRYEGNDEPTPALKPLVTTPMLSVVIEDYLVYYKKREKPAMLRKVHAVMPLLLEIVGDKPIGSLKQTDLENYFEAVQNLPPRWKDVCRQENITAKKLAAQHRAEMSKGTFDGTYLAVLTPFIKYCRRKWQDEGWPMTVTTEGVQYIGTRKDPEGAQRNFEQEELQRLFEGVEMAALAQDCSQVDKFWLPHLGLFTGARVNEICQLNPQVDIRVDSKSGIWFLDVTDDSESHSKVDKSVKTLTSKRKVPIHPTLLELGFLKYVECVKAQGHKLLFPGFKPVAGKASPKAQSWFSDFLRDIGLRDETANARIVGMHAFRSTFLHKAMVEEVVNAEAITGHTSNVTNIQNVQDGHVDEDASPVVKKYRGELPVAKKLQILQRINFDLAFHIPVTPKQGK